MTLPKKSWFIVADGAAASIFEREGRDGDLQPVKRMHSDNAQERSQDLVSDRPGRHGGGGGVHPYEGRTDPHRHEEEVFVKSVAQFLEKQAPTADVDQLVIVAPPRTIGVFRQSLSKRLMEMVAHEVEKDLVHLTDPQIADHIKGFDLK